MRIYVFDVLRVVDGHVVEHWGVPDRLGVLFQIGAVRPPVAQQAEAQRPGRVRLRPRTTAR